jgi:hypothetical protein
MSGQFSALPMAGTTVITVRAMRKIGIDFPTKPPAILQIPQSGTPKQLLFESIYS